MAGNSASGESFARAGRDAIPDTGKLGFLLLAGACADADRLELEGLGQPTCAVSGDVTFPGPGLSGDEAGDGAGTLPRTRRGREPTPSRAQRGGPTLRMAQRVAMEVLALNHLGIDGDLEQVPNIDTAVNLTWSERWVLQLAAQGLSNAAIARMRGTSVRTVANQLAASYEKLKIRGRRELKASLLVSRNSPELARERRLTFRERQVMRYADLGHTNKLIAYSLRISLSTVSTLLTRARRKLGAHEIAPGQRVTPIRGM
jgi:DNA-binding NarL/FixJ family response regulator